MLVLICASAGPGAGAVEHTSARTDRRGARGNVDTPHYTPPYPHEGVFGIHGVDVKGLSPILHVTSISIYSFSDSKDLNTTADEHESSRPIKPRLDCCAV